MNLDQVKIFLVLAEELHFGRTAERLYLSQSRVSRQIAALERQVGGVLFARSSRHVHLTPLGERFHHRLQAAYAQLHEAFDDARAAARATADVLRIGYTATTEGEELYRLVQAFETRHPQCRVDLIEVSLREPYAALRNNDIDVLINWLVFDEPDLTAGPVIDLQPRMLLVAATDPLAARDSVSIEDLAGRTTNRRPPGMPVALFDRFIPPHTPSGRPIHRTMPWHTITGSLVRVSRGHTVHPTVASISRLCNRLDIALVPIHDLPAIPLGLTWYTAHENARIRALAQTATDHLPPPATPEPALSAH